MKQPFLGQRISELRKSKGITQEELALKGSISLRTLQRVESGAVNPRSYTIRMICEVLQYDLFSADSMIVVSAQNENRIKKATSHLVHLLNLKTNTMKKLSVLSVVILVAIGSFFSISTKSKAQEFDYNKFTKTRHHGILIFWPMGEPFIVSNMKDTADFTFGDKFIQEYDQNIWLNRDFVGKAFPGDSVIVSDDFILIKSSYWTFTTSSSYGIRYLIPLGVPIKNTGFQNGVLRLYVEDNIIKESDNKIYLDDDYVGIADFGDSVIYKNGKITIVN